MLTSEPRVMVPRMAKAGEVVPVKALIAHPMETGLRRDEQGTVIPRKIINAFACRCAGVTLFSAEFHEAVAANPYVEFFIEATESGMLDFTWTEDGGASVRLEQYLTVVS